MDTNKRAFNKVSDAANKERRKQIELRQEQRKEVKVEFAAIDELVKKSNEIDNFLKSYRSLKNEVQQASQTLKEAKKINDEGYALRQEALKIGKKIFQQAKELGINPLEISGVRQYGQRASELDTLNHEIFKELPK